MQVSCKISVDQSFNFYIIRITSGPHTTAFHKKKLFNDINTKKVEFKKVIEEKKVIEKPIEKKPVLNIKIDGPKNTDRREEIEEDSCGKLARSSMGAMGVVLLSKKKTKNWLHVPARAKSKTPLFPEKETEVVPVVTVPVVPVVQIKEE